MIRLSDIEDSLIADIIANIPGIKTVETHEAQFDAMVITSLKPHAPFVLVRYGGTNPNETERRADGSSGITDREFHLTIGAISHRTKKEAQRGCYDILDDLRSRYNGFIMSVSGEPITFSYDGDKHLFSADSLVVYSLFLKWDEN